MNDIYSSLDKKLEIIENGFSLKSEVLEGGVKLVTIENTNKLSYSDIPDFLSENSDGIIAKDEFDNLTKQIEKTIASPEKMNSIEGINELQLLIRQLGKENDTFIRGLCEIDGDVPKDISDGLIYINKYKLGSAEDASSVTQSILKQIDFYKNN